MEAPLKGQQENSTKAGLFSEKPLDTIPLLRY